MRLVFALVGGLVFVGGPLWAATLILRGRPIPALGVPAIAAGRARWWWVAWFAGWAAATAVMLGFGLARQFTVAEVGLYATIGLIVIGGVALSVNVRRADGSRRVLWPLLAAVVLLVLVVVLGGFDVPYLDVVLNAFVVVVAVGALVTVPVVLWRRHRAQTGANEPGRSGPAGRPWTGPQGDGTLLVQLLCPVALVGMSVTHGIWSDVLFAVGLAGLLGSMYLRSRRGTSIRSRPD